MAKKLPPEELAKIKAGDFGHYVKDPVREETEERRGRPRKHEDARPVSFRLTEKNIRRLRAKAALEGRTPADLLNEWIEGLTLDE